MTKTKRPIWILVSLVGLMLSAPNATVIKYSVDSIDPFLFTTLRFLIVATLTTPFLIRARYSFKTTNFKHALLAGICMAGAVTAYIWAIKFSQASYVSIITLLIPIVFIIYATKLAKEKITHRAIAGISLAAAGALIIVLLPIAFKQNQGFVFYPLGTFFALINCFSFPLSIIFFKKANVGGIAMPALISISSWIVFLVSAACFMLFGQLSLPISPSILGGILYSAVIVALISRIVLILTYEKIGAAYSGALSYLEILVAIIIPIIYLKEKLSIEMIIGGILILFGVYIVEHHKSSLHKHHAYFKNS